MTTQHLLDRAYGFTSHNALKRTIASRLIYALQPSPVSFSELLLPLEEYPTQRSPAHVSGINALAIDRFEGRYLLSGGADSSIALWDLESQPIATSNHSTYRPLAMVNRTAEEHKLGITQVVYYPFDSLAFLTSSYDRTVKVYSSETLMPSASFDLNAIVYNIALSPIASHLLVACATQNPSVRLVDLRSGASMHSLTGHSGAILSTAWSPTREYILASGATDGSVRFWDIRRSVGELSVLDLEDSTGVLKKPDTSFRRNSLDGKAHRGSVNGLLWTEDGQHLITCGHDHRVRVWSTETGANTLANFGPMVRNAGLAPCIPVLAPAQNLEPEKDIMFYPNEHEILGYELLEGKLIRRLRRPAHQKQIHEIAEKGQRNAKDRITALAWRSHDVEMYSAHTDGSIAAWKPRTEVDVELDDEEEQETKDREDGKKRKRGVLDDIYHGLMKAPITFGGKY
jgi:DNA excision repair protein ERCC-8